MQCERDERRPVSEGCHPGIVRLVLRLFRLTVVVFHPVIFDHAEELERGLRKVDVDDIFCVEEDAVALWFRIASDKRKEIPMEVALEGFDERFPSYQFIFNILIKYNQDQILKNIYFPNISLYYYYIIVILLSYHYILKNRNFFLQYVYILQLAFSGGFVWN